MEITLELVERLREKADVSYEEARAVLEEADGDLLDALILLERRGRIPPGGPATPPGPAPAAGMHRPGGPGGSARR